MVWNIRGAVDSNPGLDHPGTKRVVPDWSVRGCARRRRLQEQAAKAKNIKSKERDQDGGRGEKRRARVNSSGTPWIGASGRKKRQGGKRKQPGLEHPGKNKQAGNRATRTGTSGGQKPWTGTSGEEASGP